MLSMSTDRGSIDNEGYRLHLTARDARSLAATLLYGADAIDGLDKTINDAAAEKDADPTAVADGLIDLPNAARS